MTLQIADMLPSKTIPEASNGKGPTHALKSKVTAMAPPRKKLRTCTTEVEKIKDTESHQKKKTYLIPTYSFLTPKIRGLSKK